MKRRKRTSDILFQFFWKKNLKPSLVSNPISFSILVYFELFKNLLVHQLRIYKTYWYSKCNKTMMKEFNLNIWNCDILFQMFWKKNYKPSLVLSLKIFIMLFWIILNPMGAPIKDLQDLFVLQMKQNNDKII